MFDRLVKRSNCVWIYQKGRFAEERRIFLEDLSARGYGLRALRILNPILLAVAERVNIRRERLELVSNIDDFGSCAPVDPDFHGT